MNLVIVEEAEGVGGQRYRVSGERAEHIERVLRSSVGEVVAVGLVNGPVGEGRIERMGLGEVILACEWRGEQPAREVEVDLICALPRPQTLKKVLQSAATMGVRRVHLIRAKRVERSYFHSPLLEEKNYRRFLLEGLSQGRRTRLPEVSIHRYFKRFFEDTLPAMERQEAQASVKMLPEGSAEGYLRAEWLAGDRRVLLAIGPEGGWVPFEVEMMCGLGFERFQLGPWTLRVENAMVAALGQIEVVRRDKG